jgi:hypothetical protein
MVYPYYLGGVIASLDKSYYNLETGGKLVTGYESMCSDTTLFVKGKGYKGEGVYAIDKATGKTLFYK